MTDHIRFQVELPADLPMVAVPSATLEAGLATLFENSRLACASTIRVRGIVDANTVAVRVSDDGPGVAPADRARLFEPFFTTRRAEGGIGLGLAIARFLLEAAGGTLTLEPEKPMMFRIVMPRAYPSKTWLAWDTQL